MYSLNSILSVYMTTLMPVSLSFDHHSFVIGFELGKYESSNFLLTPLMSLS